MNAGSCSTLTFGVVVVGVGRPRGLVVQRRRDDAGLRDASASACSASISTWANAARHDHQAQCSAMTANLMTHMNPLYRTDETSASGPWSYIRRDGSYIRRDRARSATRTSDSWSSRSTSALDLGHARGRQRARRRWRGTSRRSPPAAADAPGRPARRALRASSMRPSRSRTRTQPGKPRGKRESGSTVWVTRSARARRARIVEPLRGVGVETDAAVEQRRGHRVRQAELRIVGGARPELGRPRLADDRHLARGHQALDRLDAGRIQLRGPGGARARSRDRRGCSGSTGTA